MGELAREVPIVESFAGTAFGKYNAAILEVDQLKPDFDPLLVAGKHAFEDIGRPKRLHRAVEPVRLIGDLEGRLRCDHLNARKLG